MGGLHGGGVVDYGKIIITIIFFYLFYWEKMFHAISRYIYIYIYIYFFYHSWISVCADTIFHKSKKFYCRLNTPRCTFTVKKFWNDKFRCAKYFLKTRTLNYLPFSHRVLQKAFLRIARFEETHIWLKSTKNYRRALHVCVKWMRHLHLRTDSFFVCSEQADYSGLYCASLYIPINCISHRIWCAFSLFTRVPL